MLVITFIKMGISFPALAKNGLAYGFVLAMLAALATGASAGPPDNEMIFRNMRHTLLVREALTKDHDLKLFNIGVKVEDRVAYLWGPVTSRALMQRAIQIAQSLPDIRAVRNQLYIEETDDSQPLYLPPVMPEHPQHLPPTIPTPGSPWQNKRWETRQTPQPAPTTTTTRTTESAPRTRTSWHIPAGIADGQLQIADSSTREDIRYRPAMNPQMNSPGNDSFILPKITVRASQATATPVTGDTVANRLQRQIDELKAKDRKYQNVQIQLDGRRVFLSGTAETGSDLQQLAHALAHLPGVENVIIGRVQVLDPAR